jgi:hypothetical protein
MTTPRGIVGALAVVGALAGCGGSSGGRASGRTTAAGRSTPGSRAATSSPSARGPSGGAAYPVTSGIAAAAGGPTQVARAYFMALGARDGARACALSSPAQRATYLALPTGATTCAAAVDDVERSLGSASLAPLRAARVRVLSESSTHALVERVGATDRLRLGRTATGWRVTAGTS